MAKKTFKEIAETAPASDEQAFRILIAWHPGQLAPNQGSSDKHANPSVIEFAAWLARTAPVKIRVISTFARPWPATSLSKMGGKYEKWFSKESAACEAATKKYLHNAGIDKKHWDETVSLFQDGPSEAAMLTRAAKDFDADIVLINSTLVVPKGRFLSGTTVDALLNSSTLPLGLTARDMKLSKRGVTRVNYGFVDGEQEADVLLEAAQLADRWGVPLRVIAFAPEFVDESTLIGPVSVHSEISVQWREHLYALLDRAHDRVAHAFPHLNVETEVGSGRNWSSTVDAVKWKKGDLLYLASVPMGPIERVFIGSETSELIHHAPVPVVIRSARSTN